VLRVEHECRAPRVEGKRTTTSALFIPCSLRPAFSLDTLSPTLSSSRLSSFLHRSQQRTQRLLKISLLSPLPPVKIHSCSVSPLANFASLREINPEAKSAIRNSKSERSGCRGARPECRGEITHPFLSQEQTEETEFSNSSLFSPLSPVEISSLRDCSLAPRQRRDSPSIVTVPFERLRQP
jgi:hypothetical protein